MSTGRHQHALEDYFADLLRETEADSPASERRDIADVSAEVAMDKRPHDTAPADVSAHEAMPASAPIPAPPLITAAVPVPPVSTASPDPRSAPALEALRPVPELARTHIHDMAKEIAVLEEHKREQLQRMLSAQALPKTVAPGPVQTLVEPGVSLKTAAESDPLPTTAATALKLPVDQHTQSSATLASPAEAELLSESNLEGDEQRDALAMAPEILAWGDFGRPLWAENAFDVLLFDVAGLSLAVPLIALGQIVPMSDKLTKLQGQSEWFMGILPSPVGDIRTINTALFVMPERYKPEQLGSVKYVVTIDGMPWGLAVDRVNQPITLKPDDVKWRGERSKRPWLAGTVKSHMCALIDIPQMARQLATLERPRKPR